MKPSASSQPRGGNHQHLTQRSPHTRRGPAVIGAQPHAQQTAVQAQLEAAHKAQIMAKQLAKRRARKPTDKNIPEGIEELIIGDGVQQYKRLREVERKLDAVMTRKKIDINQSSEHNSKRYRTLRIWISNTVDNQPWQGRGLDADMFDFNTGVESTYKVKIEGRLLDDDFTDEYTVESSDDDDKSEDDDDKSENEDSDDPGDSTEQGGKVLKKRKKPTHRHSKTKLSHFFKAITVDFDRAKNLQPDAVTQIEWKKPAPDPSASILPAAADFDCLEFERKSDENINCTINFHRDEKPERYVLSKELADVLDTEEDDRISIILGLWEYIKALNLQQDEEKRQIQCDDRLRALFKSDTFSFPDIPNLIQPHIKPLPPISLHYTIRVDPSFHASPPQPTIYDLPVATTAGMSGLKVFIRRRPAPKNPPNPRNLQNPQNPKPPIKRRRPTHGDVLRQLLSMDGHTALLVQAMVNSKSKHAFMTELSRDPVGFVRRWTASQKRDLEIILGEAGKGEEAVGEEWRRGGKDGVWGTQNVRESVGLMVQKAR